MSTAERSIDAATQHFTQLASEGNAVPTGLEAAAAETGDSNLSKGLRSLASRLRRGAEPEGTSLSDVERLVLAIVVCKDKPRTFSQSLSDLAHWEQQSHHLRRSIGLLSIYPAALLVLSLLVAFTMGRYMTPEVRDIIDNFGIEIDAATRGLMWWHETVWGYFLVLSVVSIVGLLILARIGPTWLWEYITRNIPVLGSGLSWLDASDTCRHVGKLLQSGLSYTEAFETATAGVSSPRYRSWLRTAAICVDRGQALSASAYQLPRDTYALSTLIDETVSGDSSPGESWLLASGHFYRLGRQRIELTKMFLPVFGYLVVFVIGLSVIYGMIAPLTVLMNLISALAY